MHIDVGPTDRIVRVVIDLVLLSLIFLIDGSLRWLGLIGFMPLFTGYRCLLFRLPLTRA